MFEACMPETCVHSKFDPDQLDALISFQRNRGKKKLPQRHLMLVLDDMMYDKRVLKGQGMRDIFMNGRHLKICLINAMQYVMDMGPDLRSQVDYVFALRDNVVANRAKLWKNFFGGFAAFEDFCTVFTATTNNNECLVLDNTVKSNDIKDCVFWYKADITLPEYQIGERKFWRIHRQHFYTDDEMEALRSQHNMNHPPAKGKGAQRIGTVRKEPPPGT